MTPAVPIEERVVVDTLGHGFFRIVARYGSTERPDVPAIHRQVHSRLPVDPNRTSFLSREALVATRKRGMAFGRKGLCAFPSRKARPPTACFDLPPGRIVERGLQIES